MRICGDDSMAAEASQLTFITLARKADSLTARTSLGGWLHTTARMHTKNLIRKSHRENRKRRLLAMETPHHPPPDAWREIQPVLDDALAALSDRDREALLLRFYRALSVREVAETLGIAAGAAQKRIDRATARLRDKLTRRGVSAGGSLGGMMLAGFAADAQAAVPPVSLLASKAIAAGAASCGTGPAIATLMTAAKFSPIPFVVVLAGLTAWVGTQRKSIASLEQENASLRTGIEASERSTVAPLPPQRNVPRTARVFHADQPIDWQEVSDYLAEANRDPQWLASLRMKLQSMSPQELIAEMDKIEELFPNHPGLEQMVLRPLIEKDPALPLKHLIGRIDSTSSSLTPPLFDAMWEWVKRDVDAAAAWFDEPVSAGSFTERRLGSRHLLDLFHGPIIGELISRNPAAAMARFETIPESNRNDFIFFALNSWTEKVSDYAAFASVIREVMPEKDRLWPITAFAQLLPFEEVSGYLDAINATPEERGESADKSAEMRVQHLSYEETITRHDIEAILEWAAEVAPHAVGRVTGAALDRSTHAMTALAFDDAAKLALEYHAETGDDDILIRFLDSYTGQSNKAASREVAQSIIDPERRMRLLNSRLR